jgi:hypothetical protein
MWPDREIQDKAIAELSRYGRERHEQEPERVQLAILKLCEGRFEQLAELVTAAKRDYRDVLMWAESPAEGQALWAARANLSAEERQRLSELRRADRAQWRQWLKK